MTVSGKKGEVCWFPANAATILRACPCESGVASTLSSRGTSNRRSIATRQPMLPRPLCCFEGATPRLEGFAAGEFSGAERGAENFLKGCQWAPDGSCLLTNSDDNTLRLFNTPQHVFPGQPGTERSEAEMVRGVFLGLCVRGGEHRPFTPSDGTPSLGRESCPSHDHCPPLCPGDVGVGACNHGRRNGVRLHVVPPYAVQRAGNLLVRHSASV